MSSKKLGQTEDVGVSGSKDAFHCPAVLVCSKDTIHPGAYVRFTDQTLRHVRLAEDEPAHGIADPFVDGEIEAGTYFWVLLRPGVTHGLTHHFDVLLPDLPVGEQEDSGPAKTGLPHILIGSVLSSSAWVQSTTSTTDPPDDECGHCDMGDGDE